MPCYSRKDFCFFKSLRHSSCLKAVVWLNVALNNFCLVSSCLVPIKVSFRQKPSLSVVSCQWQVVIWVVISDFKSCIKKFAIQKKTVIYLKYLYSSGSHHHFVVWHDRWKGARFHPTTHGSTHGCTHPTHGPTHTTYGSTHAGHGGLFHRHLRRDSGLVSSICHSAEGSGKAGTRHSRHPRHHGTQIHPTCGAKMNYAMVENKKNTDKMAI